MTTVHVSADINPAAPNPSCSVTPPGITGKTGKTATYSVTGVDTETNQTPLGDSTIYVGKLWGEQPPSGTVQVWALTTNDTGNGRVVWTLTVKLKTVVGADPVSVIDGYYSRDQRTVGDPRWDFGIVNGSAYPLAPQAFQPVTIEPNEGKAQGGVVDANTMQPITGAMLTIAPQDPDLPEDWPEVVAWSGENGQYLLENIYAGPCWVTCTADGYETQSLFIENVEPGEVEVLGFSLYHVEW